MMKRLLALLACLLLAVSAAYADTLPIASLDDLPETNDYGFLPEGSDAVYYKNHAEGHWYFLSDTVRIEITRNQTKNPLLTWYIADIVFADGVSLQTETWNTERPGRTLALPQEMAERVNAVYAQSGDFYAHRVMNDKYAGHIVRNGKVLYSKSYSSTKDWLPNLATIAFFPSGKAEVNESWEVTAKEYVNRGATNVFAFGPILIRDGEKVTLDADIHLYKEPRSCIGVIDNRHYVGLLVEGRKNHSDGATLQQCADILYDYGCWDAINLDGGNTAAMLFMGESVQLANNGGVDVNDREIPDIIYIGTYD